MLGHAEDDRADDRGESVEHDQVRHAGVGQSCEAHDGEQTAEEDRIGEDLVIRLFPGHPGRRHEIGRAIVVPDVALEQSNRRYRSAERRDGRRGSLHREQIEQYDDG